MSEVVGEGVERGVIPGASSRRDRFLVRVESRGS